MFRCVIRRLHVDRRITCSKQPAPYIIVLRVTFVMPQNIKYTIFYRFTMFLQ